MAQQLLKSSKKVKKTSIKKGIRQGSIMPKVNHSLLKYLGSWCAKVLILHCKS